MNDATKLHQTERGTDQPRLHILPILALTLVVLMLLLGIEYFILSSYNRDAAYQTADMMIDQIETIMKNNEDSTDNLTDSLKDSYTTKAKAIAYIIDHVPGTDTDPEELQKIADLMMIDEIHVFDDTGRIYSGTVPEYYDYSFDSGEQMAYFKPMLRDKTLSMCQDVTPNTAEGKSMMYAICWNSKGNKMIQVGIEPVRLLKELHANEFSEILDQMPVYEGMTILVADAGSGLEILASTYSSQIGKSLSNVGIPDQKLTTETTTFTATVMGVSSHCLSRKLGENYFVIAQEVDFLNRNIPIILASLLIYLLLAALAIGFMTHRFLREQRNASTDVLTGLLNRRAYVDELAQLAEDPNRRTLTYVSMDLNGLKEVNDSMGHESGDDLLRAAATVMKDSFGRYGRVYRIGGDEFVALIYPRDAGQLEEAEETFLRLLKEWSNEHGRDLSISIGCVRAEDHPDLNLKELSRLADDKMYAEKALYYQSGYRDRRKRT